MNTSVELFQSVNLTCDAIGRPMPMYMWLKNGEIIEGATLSYLFIDRVNISDRGLYTCVANNSLNRATSFVSIVRIEGKQQPEKWVSWYACFVVSVVVYVHVRMYIEALIHCTNVEIPWLHAPNTNYYTNHSGGSRIDGRGVLRLVDTNFYVPRPPLTSFPHTCRRTW